MKRLTLKTTITATFTADDWQLYDATEGREEAAAALNRALEEAVNAPASTPNTVWRAMNAVMSTYDHLGASDSEPCGLVDYVIEQVFPEPNGVC